MNLKGNFETYRSAFQFSSHYISSSQLHKMTMWRKTCACLALHSEERYCLFTELLLSLILAQTKVRGEIHTILLNVVLICCHNFCSDSKLHLMLSGCSALPLSLRGSVTSACSWHLAAQAEFCFLLLNHRCLISSCFQLVREQQLMRLIPCLYYVFYQVSCPGLSGLGLEKDFLLRYKLGNVPLPREAQITWGTTEEALVPLVPIPLRFCITQQASFWLKNRARRQRIRSSMNLWNNGMSY